MSHMSENRTRAARVVPVALAVLVAGVALFVAWTFLKVVLFVVGATAIVILGGLCASIAVVVLAVLRRRPVSID